MDEQARQLIELIESITYDLGMQGMEGGCCNENISHAEFRALQAAQNSKVCTMQTIAESAAVTKSGATRIVGRLTEKGLANRRPDERDGRICCVTLTEEGRALMTRIEDQLLGKMRQILAEMAPPMGEILILSLKAFVQAAEQGARRQEEGFAEKDRDAVVNG